VIVNQRQQQQQQSYVPLNNLDQNGTHDVSQSEFIVCNSSLSEAAILAFEWGYSLENINSLVCWEAQFGDFANVAQAVVDESVVSAEEKWNVRSSLVMMLPHGHEGSGPDHSSARPERFLQAVNEDEDVMIQLSKNQEENISEIFRENNMDALALIEYLAREHNYYEENPELARAFSQRFVGEWMIKNRSLENEKDWIRVSNAWLRRLKEKECNIRVVNSTTPANTFHVLREQMHRSYLKPLILLTPKWLHTHRRCVSRLEEFSHGTQFERVLVDTIHKTDDENVERIVMVSGKLYYHLRGRKKNKKNLAIVRLEQIAPFPYDELLWVKDRFPNVKEWVYAQEEPKNMGCWNFVKNRVRTAGLVTNGDLKYIGRPPSASPATGSMEVHQREMMDIVRRVFDY
jgi:2-oxoglutarate dehydrogenase complex dehydrogenase (E1) component-like enzyme